MIEVLHVRAGTDLKQQKGIAERGWSEVPHMDSICLPRYGVQVLDDFVVARQLLVGSHLETEKLLRCWHSRGGEDGAETH